MKSKWQLAFQEHHRSNTKTVFLVFPWKGLDNVIFYNINVVMTWRQTMTDIQAQIKSAIDQADKHRDSGGNLSQDDRAALVEMQAQLSDKIREMMQLNESLMNAIRPVARL
ncbi:hypothetical protein [Thiothrix unzii]|uniref:Uncharacterized protein n=1 Tax=Thiothrix unzii TaxID=111769 RepID=A0A975IG63_9GAMM|nr:hypothetical protein [Thiothrix unzii]QTR52671.1 hypothetical protein J9260_13290 [Thiothrix unzii]